MKNIILKNRYTLLLTVLMAYVLVLVVEGAITGREARVLDFENPFFDLNLNNIEEFTGRQDDDRENIRIRENRNERPN